MIEITVFGDPKPAGSKRPFRWKSKDGREGISIVDANPKAKGWKQEVSRAAAAEMALRSRCSSGGDFGSCRDERDPELCSNCQATDPKGWLLTGALRVTFFFFRPRPKGHFKKDQKTLSRTGVESIAPTGRPDVLKLARGCEDALTKVVWRDDAQIVDEHIVKSWGEPARVRILIETVA